MMTYDNTKTVYDLVKNAENYFGERVFLRYEENDVVEEVTYKEFAGACHAIAAWATEQNTKYNKKIHVGLLGGNSYHYLAALLGVMSNGNVAIPLDIQMNAETLSDCLQRSDVDVLFYDWEHQELIDAVKEKCPEVKSFICLQNRKRVSCIDSILQEFLGQQGKGEAKPEECAMILFTSGTTGRGKGVMLSHANLMDNTFCTTDTEHPENEVYLSVLPVHHVFCLNGDVFIVIRYGCMLCINGDMAKLGEHIQLFQPTVMRMVPMIAKSLYHKIAVLSKQRPDLDPKEVQAMVLGKRMHKIVSGGGYLAPDLAEKFRNIGIKIAQGYGMSECSPKIAAPDWERFDKVASVGKIVDGCQVRIVDEEIQVKSPSVMMGYYKEPDKTAEVMTEDGWLCTGDIGYLDEEGFLYLTGRKKNLIVLSNGENVAPEQLENMFEAERLIADILVMEEDDVIAAEVYPNYQYAEVSGVTDIEKAVWEIIKKHNQDLPGFKRIMKCHVREIPFAKTSSKKIIRNQYFAEKKEKETKRSTYRMPQNEEQQKIYDCIAQVLGNEEFGIDTDIYDAGLDSFGSIMLMESLYQIWNKKVTMNDLMQHTTVLELESFLAKVEEQADFEKQDVYPLTNLQKYFAYVMRGNTTSNMPFLFRLDERVELPRLQQAIVGVLDAHKGLKGVIAKDENGIYQNYRYDDRKIEIPITTLSDEEWEKEKEHLIYPFSYEKEENLFHIGIYQTDSANYLFFDIAHIMGDGMTMNILFDDLNTLYHGGTVKEEEGYSFFEYILDEQERDEKGIKAQNEAYFRDLMKDFKVHKCILSRKECYDLHIGKNAVLKSRFTKLTKKKIEAFCKENAVSENVLFLTAYNYCISVFSDEKDTISSSIHSGRTDNRWSRIAGPLFLTYFFRYTNVPHETVTQLLQKSGKQIMNTMRCNISNAHPDEMFFQYQGDILNIDTIGGFPAERQKVQLDSLPFHFMVYSDEKGYRYELRYWKNRFDKEQLKLFLICYEEIIKAMLEETSVRRLKKHLPETVFPKHFYIEAGALKKEVGYELLKDVDDSTKVKAYVLDESSMKKPFGGWGQLYVMDHEPAECVDQIANPYGKGTLYQTKHVARILPDGEIDLLEHGGRTIMKESLTGRDFLDLQKLEDTLCQQDNVQDANAYVKYVENNQLVLAADIQTEGALSQEEVEQYLQEHCEPELIPTVSHIFS